MQCHFISYVHVISFLCVVRQAQDSNVLRPALESLLIMPVQRVPRYQLLLGTLVKKTPADHVDHRPLQVALAKMRGTAEFINDAIRAGQALSKLLHLQKLFPSAANLTANGRHLVLSLIHI